MATDEKDRPDALIMETYTAVIEGKASPADLRAAIELCLALPGWEQLERERALNEHLLACDRCLRRTLVNGRASRFVQSMFGPNVEVEVIDLADLLGGEPDLAHAPTKGIH